MNMNLENLNRKYVARTPHMLEIGARVTAVEPARGSMSLPAKPEWQGDPVRGLLHPGVLTVLADSACGLAVGAALIERAPYATLDLRMDYLRAAGPGQDLQCDAHCYRVTRNVAFVRAEVWQADRDQPIATAQASFMLLTLAGARKPPAGGAPAQGASLWAVPATSDPVLAGGPIPYVEYLGIRSSSWGGQPLHGGVIAGFCETAALLHLIGSLGGEKFPKSIDFSVDYLRSGRPEECFAACEVVRLGSRVALVQVRCWQSSPDNPIAVARGHFLLTAAEPDAAGLDPASP
ncbi:MAG: phenylacetic acid degradation protein [Betaproteobacteria bacterium]|nr:phenylacetic acid degradation protein [Betaproteobacteria bacterium]